MRCASCQHDSPSGARFCIHCGAALAPSCPGCGGELPAGARFCPHCGRPTQLTPGSPTTQVAEAARSGPEPLRPDPNGRAREAIGGDGSDGPRLSKSALEGERKQVTVLFADIQGSMDLAEQMDPEEWSAIMRRFFKILSDGVERFEGFVDKFTGDGIMALFGAPIGHEDHAQRACYTALYLRDELARYATELKREHGVGFSTRIGIHSGEVVVGAIGDDLGMSYTAQGHTVGLAQRMEGLASPDTCYVSAATAALVEGYLALEDLGEFRVKGLREPLSVYRLLGPGPARTRFDLSRLRGLTRFVGRDSDMAVLEDALALAQAGKGQVVGVAAEAGTGKSRLCHEFAERCRSRGIVVNFGRALAHGRHLPYLPMLEAFRAYFRIASDEDDRGVRDKIAGRLLLLDESFRDALPVLFEFFGVPDPTRPVPSMDPDAKQRQIFAVLRRAIQDPDAGAARLVVVIEDLHWLDASSEALLARWVEAVADSSALLLVNFRPEYEAEWAGRPWVRHLPLSPLGAEATRELLGDLLGDDPSVAGLAEPIHRQTSGNPFFTEEVVQALVDAGELVGRRGAYRLAVDVATIRVPASVHGILAARIDRLPEREKLVLQTAAVIGQSFTEPILTTVAELPEREVRAALATLQAGEFIYEQSPFPVAEYVFKHPLTREVALRSQLQDKRRRLHAAAARAIEVAQPDRLDSQSSLLAYHYEEAGEAIAAAAWLLRASRWLRQQDFTAARRHVERALDLLRRQPDAEEAPRLGAAACRDLLALGFRTGLPPQEAEKIFAEGMTWAERVEDPLPAALLHQAISVMCSMDCRVADALAHAAEWERVASANADPELRAYARWPSLGPLRMIGDLERARSNARWQLDASRDHPEWGLKDWALSARANALAELADVDLLGGDLSEARANAERAVEIARGVGDLETQWYGLSRLAVAACQAAEPDVSRPLVQRLVELSERTGSEQTRYDAQLRVAEQLLLDDDPRGAVEVLERAGDQLVGPNLNAPRSLLQIRLAEALSRTGETARARLIGEENCRHLKARGVTLALAEASLGLARVLLREGALSEAGRIQALLEEVDAIVAATGARLFAPQVLVERGALAGLQQDSIRRSSLLGEARLLFERMGAAGQVRRIDDLLSGG